MTMRKQTSPYGAIKAVWWRVAPALSECWQVIRVAARRFAESRATEAAAGMAFYAFFSLFPFLLFLVASGSFVLKGDQVRRDVIALVTKTLPISRELVVGNLEQVLALRGTVGVIAVISLMWSASGIFVILGRQIGRAWPQSHRRTSLEGHLAALGVVGGLAGLLFLWIGFTTALLPRLDIPWWGAWVLDNPLTRVLLSYLIPWGMVCLLCYLAYRFMPKARVVGKGPLLGAIVATLAWKFATEGFVWYLGSGFSKYHLVYGSLGSVIALLFWIYLSSSIVLFGAHLSAAVAQVASRKLLEESRNSSEAG
jgi:membrane protein